MSRVYRTEKTEKFTVMCNHHLKNKELSLKAKGLLSQMLSFPDGWNFNLKGLATLNKDGIDSIRSTMNELEEAGYVTRNRDRNEKGQLRGTEYTVREIPEENLDAENPILEEPTLDKPTLENPIQGKPILENPTQENPIQLSIKESSTKESNTNILNIHPSIPKKEKKDEIDRDAVKELFMERIEYPALLSYVSKEQLDEIVELMTDAYCSPNQQIRINGGNISTNVVKGQLMKLNMFHIQYVMQCMNNTTTKIGNIRSYLLTALYNAPQTMSNYYQSEVNHDMYGQKNEVTENKTRKYEYEPGESF